MPNAQAIEFIYDAATAHWLQQGPAGATGATGPTGPTGATGPGGGGNLSGTLTPPAIPVATGANTLGDSGALWMTAGGCKQLVLGNDGASAVDAGTFQCSTLGEDGVVSASKGGGNATLFLTNGLGFDIISAGGTYAAPTARGPGIQGAGVWSVYDGSLLRNILSITPLLQGPADTNLDTALLIGPPNSPVRKWGAQIGNSVTNTTVRGSYSLGNDLSLMHDKEMLLGFNGLGGGDGVTPWLGLGVSATPEIVVRPSNVTINGTITGSPPCDLIGAPTCGAGCASITAGSGNCVGSLSTSTLATSAVLTFSGTRGTVPFCVCTDNSVASFCAVTAVSTTSVTFGLSAALTGTVTFHCFPGA